MCTSCSKFSYTSSTRTFHLVLTSNLMVIPSFPYRRSTDDYTKQQVDTLIANASIDEFSLLYANDATYTHTLDSLRAITRTLLATGTPSLASSFTAAARSRLCQTNPNRMQTANGLFAAGMDGIHAVPTPELENILARVRSLYGAGMGFAGLGVLSSVVKATVGLQWEQQGSMADILAVIDTDISQAIQSCKEELDGGRVTDITAARDTISRLWTCVEESCRDVEIWGGEFPFERAADSIECWRV
ncbi:hypothetical protein JVU11DRAFT_8278 [Chiua virens]|nr:hypothetical protein JVU11DRAFT_8278 [Chiua virens]